MAALDALMSELRADGALDSTGQFTLDREQARSKMQKFQLADARRYVLELVQAAILRGATHIAFDIDADDMRLSFDGQPFTAAEVDDLYGSLFNDEQGRAVEGVRQLALGLNAALGMAPKYIQLDSGGVAVTMRPGQEDAISERGAALDGTTVHVRQRLSSRVVLDFFRKFAGRLEETRYLRERCLHAAPTITVGGKLISAAGEAGASASLTRWAPKSLAEVEFTGAGFRGRIAIVDDPDVATLRLVKSGVWIDLRRLPQCGTHLVAYAESEALRKDVSQAAIVQDQACVDIVDALWRARWRAWAAALERHAAEPKRSNHVRQLIRTQLLDHSVLDNITGDPVALALCEQVIFVDCRQGGGPNREVSLAQLIALVEADETPEFAVQRFTEIAREGAPIVELTQSEATRLRRLLGSFRDRTRDLHRLEQRLHGYAVFKTRSAEAVVPTRQGMLVRHDFELSTDRGAVRGQLAVDSDLFTAPERDHPLRAWYLSEGCQLGRSEFDVAIPNLWLAVEAEFTPTWTYDGPELDAAFCEVIARSLAQLGGLLPMLHARAGNQDQRAAARGLLKRWLSLMLVPGRLQRVFEIIGVDESDAEAWALPRATLVPELSLEALTHPERVSPSDQVQPAQLISILDLPLFLDFENNRLSVRALAFLLERDGELRYLPWRTTIEPLQALPGVLRLGVDDLAMVKVLFGADKVRSWADDLARRRAKSEHMAKEPQGFGTALEHYVESLRAQGVEAPPFTRKLPGPRDGFIALAIDPRFDFSAPGEWDEAIQRDQSDARDDERKSKKQRKRKREKPDSPSIKELAEVLDESWVEVLHERRPLCDFPLRLGLPLLIAYVEDPALAPTPSWDEVERETEAFVELRLALRAQGLALFDQVVAAYTPERIPSRTTRDWLAKYFLVAAAMELHERARGRKRSKRRKDRGKDEPQAAGTPVFDRVRELAIFPTVDRRMVSFADVQADLAAQLADKPKRTPELYLVSDEHPWASLREPTILRLDDQQREGLELMLEHARSGPEPTFIDGSERIRLAYLNSEIEGLPPMTEVALDPDAVWASAPMSDARCEAVVGLSRTRHKGMHIVVGTAGKRVGELGHDFALPLDAVILDKDLPLLSATEVDVRSKRFRNHLRRIRRSAPGLILILCQQLRDSPAARTPQARGVVLAHLNDELRQGNERREVRERALSACMRLPLFTDLFGRFWSLAELVDFVGGEGKRVDVLDINKGRDPAVEFAWARVMAITDDQIDAEALGWLVLVLTGAEREVVARVLEPETLKLDHEQLREQILARARAPKVTVPKKLDAVSIVNRKAQASGGLDCTLWLPLDCSPFEPAADAQLRVIFTRGKTPVVQWKLVPFLPCRAVVTGAAEGGSITLDGRSQASLERQVAVLYESLLAKARGNKLPRAQQDLALEYLAFVQDALTKLSPKDEQYARMRKRLTKLSAGIDELIPASLRLSLTRVYERPQSPAEAKEETAVKAEAKVEVKAAAKASAPEPTPEPEPAPPEHGELFGGAGSTPAKVEAKSESAPEAPSYANGSERLLAALEEGLRWTWEVHGENVLTFNALRDIRLGPSERPAEQRIAETDARGIVVNSLHPIVQRLLAVDLAEPLDAVDLTFLITAIYSLMNRFASAIEDAHEEAYLGRLAETLAVGARIQGNQVVDVGQGGRGVVHDG